MTHNTEHFNDQLISTPGLDGLLKHEIDAPPGFQSVYHETREDFLPSIAEQGLITGAKVQNMGNPISPVNIALDEHRPARLVAAGVSRQSNIYGYLDLQKGHGLYGADQRFIPQDEGRLRKIFDLLQANQQEYLRTLGALTVDSYIKTVTDPAHLKREYPGEVLELKVDPKTCYVADLEAFTDIQDGKRRGWIQGEDMKDEAQKYWEGVVSLEDFTKWYKQVERSDDGNGIKDPDTYRDKVYMTGYYCPIAGAPAHYIESIRQPEVLITQPVPIDHVKLLQ